MPFNYAVNLTDPAVNSDPQDSALQQALNTALATLSQYVSGAGTLVVQLNVTPLGNVAGTNSGTLADGGPTAEGYTLQTFNGNQVVSLSSDNELKTGNHLAGSDITIDFNSDYLASNASTVSGSLVATFDHELLHGLGVIGYRDSSAQFSGFETTFDTLSQFNGSGQDFFIGAAAVGAYGAAVPLTTSLGGSNYYHVGANGDATDPALLQNDLINPYESSSPISGLDIAILEDLGLQITPAGQALIADYASPSVTAAAETAFTDVLGRSITIPELFGVEQSLANGVSAADIRSALATTAEAGAAIASSYQQYLGRAASSTDISASERYLAAGGALQGLDSSLTGSAEFASAVSAAYQNDLARAASPGDIAATERYVAAGGTLQSLNAGLVGSAEFANAIGAAYRNDLGRAATPGDISASQQYVSSGGTLRALNASLVGSAEFANAISAAYRNDLGRAASPGDIAATEQYVIAGGTLPALNASLVASAEFANAVSAAYQNDLGRAASAGDIAATRQYVAAGGTLPALNANLTGGAEFVNAVNAAYQNDLGRAASAGDTGATRQYVAAGGTLPALNASLIGGAEFANAVSTAYQNNLGRAASSADIAASRQYVAGGGSLQALQSSLVGSAEFASGVNTATETAIGRPANAVEIAADQSQVLSSTSTAATIRAQVAELSGGAPPPSNGAIIGISPQTIAGSSPNLVYGLLNNDAVISARPLTVLDEAGSGLSLPTITGFNPVTDVIQVQSHQEANFAALSVSSITGGATVYVGNGAFIDLNGVAPSSLTASNFRFV